MTLIKNIDGLSTDELTRELSLGGKFVVYQYCISILVMTFKRSSDIYFIKAEETGLKYSFGFTILSLLFGWWGIPWGPIYTISSVFNNLSGGVDVTQEVVNSLNERLIV